MEQVKSCEECPYEEMCIETVKRGISVYCGGSLCRIAEDIQHDAKQKLEAQNEQVWRDFF